MARDHSGDPESILTADIADDSHDTLLFRNTAPLPSLPPPIEIAITRYADSLEQLLGADGANRDDAYTRGFVAGLRAAAQVAATVAGS